MESEKTMIYLSRTGSSLFSEAYLVVRPGARRVPQSEMVAEARRVIREYSTGNTVRKVTGFSGHRQFIRGAAAGIGLSAFAALIAALFLL